LKIVILTKTRKWRNEQCSKQKILKTNIIFDAISLALSDLTQLEQFILWVICAKHKGIVLEKPSPYNLIFKVISSFCQWREIAKNVTKPGSSNAGKKWRKTAANITKAFKNLKNQIIFLSNDNIASQTKVTL
jgi:hypothetical protein